MPRSESTSNLELPNVMCNRIFYFRTKGRPVKRRVFTQRRHAEIVARRRLKVATWIGTPIAVAAFVWEVVAGAGTPMLGPVAFAMVIVAYTLSMFRVHSLTGEWTFF